MNTSKNVLMLTIYPKKFYCRYLKHSIELSEDREKHILEAHPDLLPEYEARIKETLFDPDQVRRSLRFNDAKLFLSLV